MSRFWTDDARGPAPRAGRSAAARRAAVRLIAAGVLLLIPACGKSVSDTQNHISPIVADIRFETALPMSDPSVYFKKVSATGDLVVVDVVLHATSPITFDAFNLDVTFDPRIVQLGGTTSDPDFNQTPFCGNDANDPILARTCACNSVITGVCSNSSSTACATDSDCAGGTCVKVCANSEPTTTNPICLTNAGRADISGELLWGVAAAIGKGCPAVTTSAADTRLFSLGFAAASTGTSPIRFVPYSSTNTGGCAILSGSASLGIPCEDGGASLVANR